MNAWFTHLHIFPSFLSSAAAAASTIISYSWSRQIHSQADFNHKASKAQVMLMEKYVNCVHKFVIIREKIFVSFCFSLRINPLPKAVVGALQAVY